MIYVSTRGTDGKQNIAENFYSDNIEEIYKELDRLMKSYISPEMNPEDYIPEDLSSMVKELVSIVPQMDYLKVEDIKDMRFHEMYDKLREAMYNAYRDHEREIITFYNDVMKQYGQDYTPQELYADNNIMRSLERDVLLRVVDNKWIDHLHNIDMLKDGIGLRAYGQKDPLIEYKREAYDLYNNMMHEVQGDTVKYLFRTKFGIQFVGEETV